MKDKVEKVEKLNALAIMQTVNFLQNTVVKQGDMIGKLQKQVHMLTEANSTRAKREALIKAGVDPDTLM